MGRHSAHSAVKFEHVAIKFLATPTWAAAATIAATTTATTIATKCSLHDISENYYYISQSKEHTSGPQRIERTMGKKS